MRCASCNFDNPEGMHFCQECGTKLVQTCPSCGQEIRPTAKFCGRCGTVLEAAGKLSTAKSRKRKGAATPRQTARPDTPPTPSKLPSPEAERRQLTVMFCDLVGSTALSEQIDPEELREVVHAYHQLSAEAIGRFDGQVAQHLGDGLLVYFGYPTAHEDDAVRAVRAGLEIVTALRRQVTGDGKQRKREPLHIRIGIHSGLVVIGEIGSGEKREMLALGETPNIAARIQGTANPDEVMISAATYHLVEGQFDCEARGQPALKGMATLLTLYRVSRESEDHSRFDVVVRTGLTPLVGREPEFSLLRERWAQVKVGAGQVVLLSGEAGIGKSRLIQELKEQLEHEGVTSIEFRCSPYHQHSAFYPIIEHLQRLLQFEREELPQAKLDKLQQTLAQYRFPQADTVPLLAALLLLPHPEGVPPITLSPQKQKQKTQEALVAWIVEEAERQVVYCAWEDLHWADPSTLEVLTLFLDQVPSARLLVLLTFRPEFMPPWGNRSHLSQMTLSRLGGPQVEEMVGHVIARTLRPSTSSRRTESQSDKEIVPVRAEPIEARIALSSEAVQQIVTKTDGVPLFVEELTKMILESGLLKEEANRYILTAPFPAVGIPATLQDSLVARLDRLGPIKEVVQLAATLGREFSYDLLNAVSQLDEIALQRALDRLVEAELLYRRRLPSHELYVFKHAMIQEVAYQSLLRSTRRQSHRQIAHVLQERFPEVVETQPELLAHHYTEAGLGEQAIAYWQRAGQRAVERSANVEAATHLNKGLELLKDLSPTPEHIQQELLLQTLLGSALMATRGFGAPEVGNTYARARELCQQVGDVPQIFPVLRGLAAFYSVRADYKTTQALGEQCLRLAQHQQDSFLLLAAHFELGVALFCLGDFLQAREHWEQTLALYEPKEHRSRAALYGQDLGVSCLSRMSRVLWFLGYPDQALQMGHAAIALAQEIAHPFSLAYALNFLTECHRLRGEVQASRDQAETAITLSTEQGFQLWATTATMLRGWTLAEQGQGEEGIAQIRQGLAIWQAMGAEMARPHWLALLAEGYGRIGQPEQGLPLLEEALTVANNTGEREYEAEVYRLKGELSLKSRQVTTSLGQVSGGSQANQDQSKDPDPRPLAPDAQAEAEACFHKAIEIARRQQAKSLELRAVMSLARLWQQQGKKEEARRMLAEIYVWFTEGFDTKDLQEATTLLEDLS